MEFCTWSHVPGPGVSGIAFDGADRAIVSLRGDSAESVAGWVDVLLPNGTVVSRLNVPGEIWGGYAVVAAYSRLVVANARCTDRLNLLPCLEAPAVFSFTPAGALHTRLALPALRLYD